MAINDFVQSIKAYAKAAFAQKRKLEQMTPARLRALCA
jgi:hypothetical protein